MITVVERDRAQGFGYVRIPLASPLLLLGLTLLMDTCEQPHGRDLLSLSRGEELTDYLIQFVATLDPNGHSNRTISWPRYDSSRRQMLRVLDDKDESLAIGQDDAREEAMEFMTALSLRYPL